MRPFPRRWIFQALLSTLYLTAVQWAFTNPCSIFLACLWSLKAKSACCCWKNLEAPMQLAGAWVSLSIVVALGDNDTWLFSVTGCFRILLSALAYVWSNDMYLCTRLFRKTSWRILNIRYNFTDLNEFEKYECTSMIWDVVNSELVWTFVRAFDVQ